MNNDEVEVPYHEDGCATPEQLAAIKYANENGYPIEILVQVAKSIPQTVPDGSDTPGWKYGACRRVCKIGGYDPYAFVDGHAPKDADLSDIRYFGFYRQAVKNKYTGEIKGFASVVGTEFYEEVKPSQTIDMKGQQCIRPGWKREDVEAAAREAFVRLQKMCEEFYNRES